MCSGGMDLDDPRLNPRRESALRPAKILDALYDLEPMALLQGEPYRIGRLDDCWGFPLVGCETKSMR